ncbi:MAG: Hsp70 family protein [Verrucomicrobia bacterium]|nr:Hsp70 family protein [Verrucomicrobiota bacterium]
MMNETIVGIDLGTTYSAIGVVDSGFPMLLADEEGKRIMPSAVWYGAGGKMEVGRRALRRRELDGLRVVTSVKRYMGRELSAAEREVLQDRSPVDISATILRELKCIAEWRLGRAVNKAVITVPAYFHDGQRNATKRAGELAGFEVLRVLNEPTAAALAYGLDKLANKSRVAVYDFGGGTFDLSLLEMQNGVFQVLATHGDTRLGGDDLDRVVALKMLEKAGIDEMQVSRELMIRWLGEAERVKCALSANERECFSLPFYAGHSSFSHELSRGEFESWIQPWIARTIACCNKAMSDAGMLPSSVDALVLVGGSTRIPAVRAAAEACFQRTADVSQHPDEAIALGATIQAGVMSGAMKKLVLLDVTPLSLGIETLGGLMNVLIPRNTTIPCKAGEMFTNAATGQTAMMLRVLQGERELACDNWELGRVEIAFAPMLKGQARIGVQFRIDENGILEVLARDVKSGRDQILQIQHAAVNVSDESVEKMVSDSVEFAFADMAERVWTEARLKAEELLPAVDAALEIGAQWLSAEERERIDLAAARVREVMPSKQANALKAAVQELDKATENLAAKIVEQAMEQALPGEWENRQG